MQTSNECRLGRIEHPTQNAGSKREQRSVSVVVPFSLLSQRRCRNTQGPPILARVSIAKKHEQRSVCWRLYFDLSYRTQRGAVSAPMFQLAFLPYCFLRIFGDGFSTMAMGLILFRIWQQLFLILIPHVKNDEFYEISQYVLINDCVLTLNVPFLQPPILYGILAFSDLLIPLYQNHVKIVAQAVYKPSLRSNTLILRCS